MKIDYIYFFKDLLLYLKFILDVRVKDLNILNPNRNLITLKNYFLKKKPWNLKYISKYDKSRFYTSLMKINLAKFLKV